MTGARRAAPWLARMLCACIAGSCGPDAPAGPPCGSSMLRGELFSTTSSSADLLIVVSDAPSMAQEQALLARELPALVHALVSGDLGPGGRHDPLHDVHVGVLSSDLGVAASPLLPGCSAIGRDASLQLNDALQGCGELPAFLRYRVPVPETHPLVAAPGREEEDRLAAALACGGVLGSAGCAVVQPLEAALRALWPSGLSLEHSPHVAPAFARAPQGQRANLGFLRSDPGTGASVLEVLVISDGDDCSLQHPQAFADALNGATLAPALACVQRPELLHEVGRYARGLRALRPNDGGLVVFSAITGVPDDLALPVPHYDPALRAAQFEALLADPRMRPEAGPDGALRPVCESMQASATPAPRLIELARSFGESAALLSICSPDWRPALRPLLERTDSHLGSTACLPRKPIRDASGLVQCDVLWELPPRELAREGTPSECSELPFLREHAPQPRTDDGRAVCEVPQLAVTGLPAEPRLAPGSGWFLDDFSPSGRACFCPGGCNTIFFAPSKPPPGIAIRVECFETTCLSRDGAPCDPAECPAP